MSEFVRTSRSGRRLSVVRGSPAAGSNAAGDLLSIIYWVDDIVAEYVAGPELPGRDRVIARATALRADCRRLAEESAPQRRPAVAPARGTCVLSVAERGLSRRRSPALRRARRRYADCALSQGLTEAPEPGAKVAGTHRIRGASLHGSALCRCRLLLAPLRCPVGGWQTRR